MQKNFTEIIERIKLFFDKEQIDAKTFLVKEGAIARHIYFIESGAARAWFTHTNHSSNFACTASGQFLFSCHVKIHCLDYLIYPLLASSYFGFGIVSHLLDIVYSIQDFGNSGRWRFRSV